MTTTRTAARALATTACALLCATGLAVNADAAPKQDAPTQPTLSQLAQPGQSAAVSTKASGGFSASAYTKTLTRTTSYKSLAGLTVIKHYGYTTWTYSGGGTMYSSPRAVSSSYWTAPLNYNNGQGASWDWYNTGSGATARSNIWARFTFGVPTPWGPIGSTTFNRQLTTVNGSGGYTIVA